MDCQDTFLTVHFIYCNYKTGYVILYLFKIFSNFYVWKFDREKYFFLYFIEPQPSPLI